MTSRVVVGIDFSPTCKKALERAAEWAQRLDVPLFALHVLQEPGAAITTAGYALADPKWIQATEDHARATLKEWLAPHPGTMSEVVWGSAPEELLKRCDADSLLVVGQKGRSPWERFLFGATTSKVVAHAPCEVLVIPAAPKKV
ncbi:MAG TPA: universal stress protein [Holophagaceae bacterium]|nr:universal stress protein [Holophagaceae bacterium]